jgi:thiaminase
VEKDWLSRTYDRTVSEEWMDIHFNGQKIGFSYQKTEQGPKGYRITGRAVIRFEIADVAQDMSFSRSFYMDPDKSARGFISLQTIGDQRQRTVGDVIGGDLVLDITGAGGESRVVKKLAPGVQFMETLELLILDKLKPGAKMTIPVFLVEMRTQDTIAIEIAKEMVKVPGVDGKPVDAYVVESRIQGMATKSYITPSGEKLKEESVMGFTSVRTDEKNAAKFPTAVIPITSLITFSLVKPDKPIKSQSGIKELKLSLSGFESPVTIPSDTRQVVGTGGWSRNAGGKNILAIPVTVIRQSAPGAMTIQQAGKAQASYLNPSPEIQSDNKMIAKEARAIVGGEQDAYKAAVAINRWVYSNIKKKLVDSFTAVDVLLSKEGECQSHANLFVAMARSLGIPARVAAGIVYSSEHEGFLYHAWVEVYAGSWINMDPTLGQNLADATHVKLSGGELENLVQLFQFLVKMNISVQGVAR